MLFFLAHLFLLIPLTFLVLQVSAVRDAGTFLGKVVNHDIWNAPFRQNLIKSARNSLLLPLK